MKLVHVVPHIDQEAAGPSYSVPRLCQALAQTGNDVTLSCLAARGQIADVTLELHPQWSVFPRFAISSKFAAALRRALPNVDVVHNHSLWSMVNVACGWLVPGRRPKLVTSPRGTLSAWALGRNRRLKRLLWPLQRRALQRADLLHATSEVEYGEIRGQGFKAPVAIIPNGIDLPDLDMVEQVYAQRGPQRTVLFLSRIHPTKGLDLLLQAWLALQDRHPDWRLVIAGKGESEHVVEVQALARTLGVVRVEFPGPLYGDSKTRAYGEADVFVLPTHSENFGMVVAEALSHACPAIVSQGAPWPGLLTEECGWWVRNEVNTLGVALADAMSRSPAELHRMGLRGREWMARDYSWASIGERMDASYRWLLNGGREPAWIKLT